MSRQVAEEEERKFLEYVLRGNEDAVEMCMNIYFISQVWDDIIDVDDKVSKYDINRAFYLALVDIPQNTFYKRHSDTLVPMMDVFITDWLDANNMEDEGQNLELSYVLRDSVGSLLTHCAKIVGGYDWMRKISGEVRQFNKSDYSIEDYIAEHKS